MKKRWKPIVCVCLAAALCAASFTGIQLPAQAAAVKEDVGEDMEKEILVSTPSEAQTKDAQSGKAAEETAEGTFEIENGKLVKYDGEEEEVVVPAGVTVIGEKAFGYNTYIRRVVIPEGVTEIQGYAFRNCSNLENVELPKSLKKLGWGVFFKCALQEIRVTNNWTIDWNKEKLEIGPFRFCDNLKTITIEEGVTKIPEYLFENCKGLEEVDLKGIAEIGAFAFRDCESLAELQQVL